MFKRILGYWRRKFWSPERYAKLIGVQIGNNCLISTKRFSSEAYLIKIGNYCRIAPDVAFYTHGGLWSQRKKHNNLDFFGKITIGDYTYIGDGAKIMPGVTIGSDVIVGAGTVVTKSIPDGCIVAGNPGRIVGKTIDFVQRIQTKNVNSYGMNYEDKKEFLLGLDDDKFIQK